MESSQVVTATSKSDMLAATVRFRRSGTLLGRRLMDRAAQLVEGVQAGALGLAEDLLGLLHDVLAFDGARLLHQPAAGGFQFGAQLVEKAHDLLSKTFVLTGAGL